MNSISKNLTANSVAATARMLRSARKEIFLIVEGDDDIALFSHSLSIPRSNFISCFGKERLMEVFSLAPCKGIDSGTIFLRDADCDFIKNRMNGEVPLFSSDCYDFEMSLLPRRVFGRMFGEFIKTKSGPEVIATTFDQIIESSSLIGALRLLSHQNEWNLDFKNAKFGFFDHRTIKSDVDEMIKYFYAKSKIKLVNLEDIKIKLERVLDERKGDEQISSGKDFLRIFSILLSRHFKCCNSGECTFETLSRMFRMIVTHDDIRELGLYRSLSAHVSKSPYQWMGAAL